MQLSIVYWLLFVVRVVLFAVILHDYGWKAALLAFAYATTTGLSEVC